MGGSNQTEHQEAGRPNERINVREVETELGVSDHQSDLGSENSALYDVSIEALYTIFFSEIKQVHNYFSPYRLVRSANAHPR